MAGEDGSRPLQRQPRTLCSRTLRTPDIDALDIPLVSSATSRRRPKDGGGGGGTYNGAVRGGHLSQRLGITISAGRELGETSHDTGEFWGIFRTIAEDRIV